jgi:hypothetical protein
MAQYDQRVQLVRAFLGRPEPVNVAGWKNTDSGHRLNQRQVACVANTAAMFGISRVRVLRCEPRYLREQDAVRNQHYQRELSSVGAPGDHSSHYKGGLAGCQL